MTQAPHFLSILGMVPLMHTSVAAGEQLSALSKYFMDFSNWEAHLKLYPDAKYMQETEYHVLFIDGLTSVLKNMGVWSFSRTTAPVILKRLP